MADEQTTLEPSVEPVDGYHGWDNAGRAILHGSFDPSQLRAIARDLERLEAEFIHLREKANG